MKYDGVQMKLWYYNLICLSTLINSYRSHKASAQEKLGGKLGLSGISFRSSMECILDILVPTMHNTMIPIPPFLKQNWAHSQMSKGNDIIVCSW